MIYIQVAWDYMLPPSWGGEKLGGKENVISFDQNIGNVGTVVHKLFTWNVFTAVLQYLKGQKVDIVALVEMHVTGHLQAALKRPWVGWAYHSTHTNMSRGVTVLIAKSTPFELVSMVSDRQGRYLFLHAIVGGDPLLILASYIPPHTGQMWQRVSHL